MRIRVLTALVVLTASIACSFSLGQLGDDQGEPPDKVEDQIPETNDARDADVVVATALAAEAEPSDSQTEQAKPDADDLAALKVHPVQVEAEPIGNGMQMVTIWFSLENVSSDWHSFAVSYSHPQKLGEVGASCLWLRRRAEGAPILRTEEGYGYEARRISPYCGPLWVPTIPPGLIVTAVGETFSEVQDVGWVSFEIPDGSHPKSVEFWYGNPPFWYGMEDGHGGWHTTVLDLRDEYVGALPFDPAHADRIYRTGEVIEAGEVATIVVESLGTGIGGDLPVVIVLTNTHPGYAISVEAPAHTLLVNEDGELCCESRRKDWGIDRDTRTIGQGQSSSFRAEFDNPSGKRVWLLMQLRLEEVSPDDARTEISFVVELP